MSASPSTAAARDRLTKLADRHTFFTSLKRDCLRTVSSGGMLALLILNVNQFRRINTIFGFKIADKILVRIAGMMKELGRRDDLVARIGSDEFALILPHVMNEGHAVLAANKLLRQLEAPLEIDNERVPVMVTIGIAICPKDSSHPEFLLKQGELALLKARRSGTNYLVAEPDQNAEISDNWDMEIELESAIEEDSLELYYQPQVEIASRKPVRAEALMRWHSPSRGLLRPSMFIPIAEQTGHIRDLTQWALNAALRQIREFNGNGDYGIGVSVNMSASAFQNSRMIDTIVETMGLWGTAENVLTIEVTESVAMADPELAFNVLQKLREAGTRVAIDDFGTGYSSLSYFRDVPADELKIDRSFISDLTENRENMALTRLMVELGHEFGMKIVAEGVENVRTLAALSELGCDLAQGNLVGKAMPADEFDAWMRRSGGDWLNAKKTG